MPKIVIEGIDGSGKSSLIAALTKSLNEAGVKATFLSEPTDEARAKLREASARGTFHADAPAIFREDRQQVINGIEEKLLDGETVILDRHMLSTIAYQGVKEDIVKIASEQLWNFAPPDLTILLDLPAETAVKRLKAGRSENELEDDSNKHFEQLDYLKQVRKNYHRFLGVASVHSVVIDATRPPDAVAAIATNAVLALLGKTSQKMPQSIFCVPTQTLVKEGFILESDRDTNSTTRCRRFQNDDFQKLQRALQEGMWVERVLAETNEELKQIIPAIVVLDPFNKILNYTRKGKEERLHRQVSINLGGHIDPEDVSDAEFFKSDDWGWQMVKAGANRELHEELGSAANFCDPLEYAFGIINDDSNEVGRVHFGILLFTKSKAALHLRFNEETGAVQTKTPEELKTNPNLEGWAKAILATF